MSTIIDKAVTRAVKNVWTNPQEDRRITFKPVIFSKRSGAVGYLELPWDTFTLPDNTNRYLVLQLGQLSVKAYGIETPVNDWVLVSDLIKQNEMFLQIYTNQRMLFTGDTYVRRVSDGSVFFAVNLDHNEELVNLKEDIYLRFYSNAWLATTEGTQNAGVDSAAYYVESIPQASVFINRYRTARQLSGNMFFYHNGRYVDDIHILDVQVGDRLEYINDRTGNGYFDSYIDDMKAFDSTIDAKRKYIVLQPDNGNNGIMPSGDIEIYICNDYINKNGDTVTRGVYYPCDNSSTVRSLTHRDWSIDVMRVQNIISAQDIDFDKPYIRVFLRHATWESSLIEDGNLIKDLYALGIEKRAMLMSTAASPVPLWKAENLEHCPYVRWMELSNLNLSLDNLKGVYSYHGLNTMVERAYISGTSVILPPIMKNGGVVFLYGVTGKLVRYTFVNNDVDLPIDSSIAHVECFPGQRALTGNALETSSLQYNDPVDNFAQDLIYRTALGAWKVAKEGTDFTYDIENKEVNWDETRVSNLKGKRLSGRYFLNDFDVKDRDLGSRFPIFADTAPPGSGLELGRLKVWLNGRPLVRGLEFVVEYPYYRILARELYTEDTVNVVTLFSGLDADRPLPTVGFVKYGKLNHDVPFDISFNRDKEIIIGGHIASYDQIVFNEDPSPGVMDGRFKNGMPYSIEYPLNHIDNITSKQLTRTKQEAIELDSVIENYLTTVTPENVQTNQHYIDGLYALFSPFMATLIEDILNGTLGITYTDPSSGYVSRVCSDYLYLLESDPTRNDLVDWDFIDLHPTGRVNPVTVQPNVYAFLQKANELYMGGRCNLNTYIQVNPGV